MENWVPELLVLVSNDRAVAALVAVMGVAIIAIWRTWRSDVSRHAAAATSMAERHAKIETEMADKIDEFTKMLYTLAGRMEGHGVSTEHHTRRED